MRIELIERIPIGSSVTVTLETGDKISGSLTEIGDDYIILGQMESVLEAETIISVQKLDNPVPLPFPNPAPDPANFDRASEKLAEIEKRFKTEIQTAQIELKPPDFTFPADELPGWQNTSVASLWVQIKNQYNNAQKINELSPKFGRIQKIVTQAKSLTERFPASPALKRDLAYLHSISDNWDEILQNYQESAVQSKKADDWFGVAVSALKLNKEELACYGLEQFFYSTSIIDAPQAWSVYVNLLERFNNLPAFRELCKTDKYDIEEKGIEVLLETSIYLLKKTGTEALATGIIQKWLTGESTESLLRETCQELDGQPAESYRQFLTKFMNAMIASEKKSPPTTPQRPKHISTVKQPIHRTTPQKQKPQTQVSLGGEDLYKEAERADKIEKNLEKAERLYQECIRLNIRPDSAIMDLAMVYVQLEQPDKAVKLLEDNRHKVNKQRLNNLLTTTVYPKAGQHDKVIDLLNSALKQAQNKEKRSQIRWQIASAYIKLEDYESAESQLRQARKLRPDNIAVQRSLAFCCSKQERYDEAEEILNRIQNTSPDARTAELLEAVERAKATGEFILDDDRITEIETALSYFSGELSEFAQFFLDRCVFDGVSPGSVNEGKYTGSEKDFRYDIGRLEDIAKQLGTRRPRERSYYYLSAARIYFDLGDNQNFFYRYLCRSFASRGDAAVSENKHLDTVREWYCEALTVYDGDRNLHKDEQDAVNSLVRYLYSTWGHGHIRLTPNTPTIDKVVRDVISNHPDRKKVFDAIIYLVLHSRYAADKVLNRLYSNETLRTMALNYLEDMEIAIPDAIEGFNDFVRPWNELQNEKFNRARTISNKLRLLDNFELTTAWLEDNIRLAEDIRSDLFFNLDQQRVGELQKILETALELCKQGTFEERERLCIQLRSYCQALLGEIEESPTRLSVEDVYPIIEVIQEKVNAYLEELHVTSKPQLTLRLPVESYVPDTDRKIEVQIVLENEEGRMSADALKLVTQADKALFEGTVPDVELAESLRGGKEAQVILKVPLRLTDAALQSEAFSLPVYAEYRIRGGKQDKTQVENLSIRLDSEAEFEKIHNSYAPYAGGNEVGDPDMFFGRKELIADIAHAIRESRFQSKCVLVYGQYRSGKSSVLYHLSRELQKDKDLLILDLRNIKLALDTNSSVAILYQILMHILRGLKDAVDNLELSIPDAREFYSHPTPLQFFEDIFKNLKMAFKQANWGDVRVVLLIDEFQYIYDLIVTGDLPTSFMKDWKALLQGNHFSAVLVGQDVMPKFKGKFANEFGTTQDKRVTYLNEENAVKLIEDPIRIGGRQGESRYREQSVRRILDLTAGSPYYIQIICDLLVRDMNRKRAPLVTEADVEHVKEGLITGENALDKDKFHSLTNSGDISEDAISEDDARAVLKAIADNSGTDFCSRDRIVCETHLEIDEILADLVRREVVERREQSYRISYRIRVGLFKEWLVDNG